MSIARRAALTGGLLALGLVACHKVPYTGRRQLNLIPDSIMRGVGKSSYSSTLSAEKVEKKGPDHDRLVKVGNKISKVADQPKYDWNFSLIDDEETINAWCLPGGYIAFYTGILPVLQSEAGMAFVMGHETAHATAHHGAERMSQQLTLIGGLAGLEIFMANATDLEPGKRAIILGALGLGAEVGILLPFSRTHESEADVIGMMYAAEAGYPPEESIALWDRMDMVASSSIPAFLSTHPSNDKRKANLKEWMPQARKKYERHKLPGNTTEVVWAGLETSGSKKGRPR
ncbi:MAG: M48 family metallopeptidase [Myxococcales bacterium]|nr:M48 family metallopeptidase [Myxococcales bacterium]